MENKLAELREKRRLKLIEYTKTPTGSWKKKLRQFELQKIDINIKIERLKQQFN